MRIVHTSDIHVGMENYGRVDPTTGVSSRLTDFLDTFDEVVDYSIGHRADLFLFAGDAFKTRDPNPTQQREFARRIARIRAAGVPVFLLVGNHDLPNAAGKATPLDIYHALELEGVTVGARPGLHFILTPSGPLQIAALPWVLRSGIVSKDDYKNRTLAEIHEVMLERVQRVVDNLATDLDPSIPAVLACHGTVFGATLGAERNIMLGQDLILNRSIVCDPRFQYVALGHIHRHQVIATRPLAIYPGSLQRIDFGEQDETKGFVVVDIGPAEPETWDRAESDDRFVVTYEFHPVGARPFVTIRVDADVDDPTEAVIEAIGRAEIADKVVRLQIQVSESREGLLREAEIRRALKDAYFVAAIGKEVRREHRSRLGGRTTGEITPFDALQAYLDSKRTPPDRAATLLEYGRRLMSAE